MTTINEALSEFLLDQKARLNAPKTIQDYREKVGLWTRSIGVSTSICDVTPHAMRSYVAGMQDRGLARESIRAYIRCLRVYWKFVADEYQIENPMQAIKEPLRRAPQPKAVQERDFIKLLEATDDTEAGIRDRAILLMFADTGTRLGGIVSLTMDHLDTIRRRATVIEKGYRHHTIYWTYYTNLALDRWLNVRPACESDSVFVSMREGRAVDGLTKSGIYQVLKRLKGRAGVTGKANPHAFRHNFAKQYLLSGGEIVSLARLLGHKNINLTADYYAIFDHNELAALQAEHSPLLKMLSTQSKG